MEQEIFQSMEVVVERTWSKPLELEENKTMKLTWAAVGGEEEIKAACKGLFNRLYLVAKRKLFHEEKGPDPLPQLLKSQLFLQVMLETMATMKSLIQKESCV